MLSNGGALLGTAPHSNGNAMHRSAKQRQRVVDMFHNF